MKEAEQRGELIRVEAVRSALASIISSTRERLLQLPARLVPVIEALKRAVAASELDAQIYAAGAEVGSQLAKPLKR